jgi:glycosyltransferase involved in cell wall biosynthesis
MENLTHGGIESSLLGLTTELAKSNEVVVFDIPRSIIQRDFIEIINGIRIFRFSKPSFSNSSSLFRVNDIRRLIIKEKPDICHLHTSSIFILVLSIFLKSNNIKTIITIHGLAHEEKKNEWRENRTFKRFLKFISQSLSEFIVINSSSILIVDTQYLSNRIHQYKKQLKIFKIPSLRIIPQGVNLAFFRLKESSIKYDLISIGSFVSRKGHLHLIETMEKLHDHLPRLTLSIIGTKSDIGYYNELLTKIRELRLESNIDLYADLPFQETLQLLEKSGIFVLHSQEESQGIVLCEAMAAGKPVVATNVGGIPFIIKHGVNGLLSEYGNIEQFTNNVITLLNNKSYCESISLNNIKASGEYKWSIITKDLLQLYRQVIKE